MPKLKVAKQKKTKLINVKVNIDEGDKMQANANKYCEGNLSEWIRYSSMNLKPRKSDLVD